MSSDVASALNGVNFESFNHTNTILKGLNDLRLKECLFDITVIAENRSFKAHKAVLAACSDYFRAMFTDCMREARQNEVTLNNVSALGIELVLEYIYTSKLQLNLANIQDVLSAASYTQLESIVEACLNYLQQQIDIDNCIDILTISETYSLVSLKQKVYRFICGHLFEVSKSSEFYRLSSHQMNSILACDFPVDCNESMVLRIVLQWVVSSSVSNEVAAEILQNIRFSEMSLTAVKQALAGASILQKHEMYKVVIDMARAERKKLRSHVLAQQQLVNIRGMELALIKVGGFDLSGITNEITYCFPNAGVSSVWRYLSSIPHIKQSNFGTVVLNNQLYVVGGCYDILTSSLEEYIHPFGFRYCPVSNKWQTIAPMNQDRCRFSLNVVGNALYAVGGVSESHDDIFNSGEINISSGERYNPETDRWEFIMELPEYRSQHASAAVDRYLYICGGLDPYGGVLNTFWKYNTTCNYWTKLPPMLHPRADHVVLHIGSKLYVCGGWYEINTTRVLSSTIDVFNYATNTWSTLTRIPTPKFHAGIVAVNNKIYIIGGFCSDDIFRHTASTIEVYDLDKNTWHKMEKYPKNIWEHTCAILYIPKCREDMEVIISD